MMEALYKVGDTVNILYPSGSIRAKVVGTGELAFTPIVYVETGVAHIGTTWFPASMVEPADENIETYQRGAFEWL